MNPASSLPASDTLRTSVSTRAGVRIALDAFGGDHCPKPEIEGAIEAASRGVEIVLVGDGARLARELKAIPSAQALPISIHHAPDTIAMGDSPSKAVRAKPDASMPVC